MARKEKIVDTEDLGKQKLRPEFFRIIPMSNVDSSERAVEPLKQFIQWRKVQRPEGSRARFPWPGRHGSRSLK